MALAVQRLEAKYRNSTSQRSKRLCAVREQRITEIERVKEGRGGGEEGRKEGKQIKMYSDQPKHHFGETKN